MKTPFNQMQGSVALFVLLGFVINVSADTATPQPKVSKQQIQDLKSQVNEIKKQQGTINRYNKQTQDLKKINEVERTGLSKALKTLTPEGGRFEIRPDGTIKIIPNDVSIVKKLINKAGSVESASSDSKTTPQEIPTDAKELIERLRKANNQGLSSLLNKLSTDGGQFELIENGGIKIIPNDAAKSKELVTSISAASKLVKEKNLTGLDKSLRNKQKELTRLSKSLGAKQEKLNNLSQSLQTKQRELTALTESLRKKKEKLTGLSESLTKAKVNVDSWEKVRDIAKNWIKENNKKEVLVGKIRQVRWLYLVSIVDDKGYMDSQLVVRASDGKLIAFTKDIYEISE